MQPRHFSDCIVLQLNCSCYQVTYDFTMIQGAEPGQDPLAILKVRTSELRLNVFFSFSLIDKILIIVINFTICFLSQTMLKHRRINCLSHPVCFNVMSIKW